MLAIVLSANCAMAFGLFVGASAPSLNAAMAIGPVVVMPMVMFSGFLINNSELPVYFRWFEVLSFFKYTFHIAMNAIWEGVDEVRCTRVLNTRCRFRSGRDGECSPLGSASVG
jgi:hypothetical protein